MTVHYHGGPVTPTDKMLELAGLNFCVSYASPQQVYMAHDIGSWRRTPDQKTILL